MKLAVFSHKPCWRSEASPSGYATDGGFPFQMWALSEIFEATRLLVPVVGSRAGEGEAALSGHSLVVVPLTPHWGKGIWRKVVMPLWLLRNGAVLVRELWRADAVHAPIPGDIGTVGMLSAVVLRKPLFVRHCGNWFAPRTVAERFWRWFMERFAGGRNVMFATGGAPERPSRRNPNVHGIFASSLREEQLRACAIRRQGVGDASPTLVIACRQEKAKGTGVVIRSLPILKEHLPNIRLNVVGDGTALGEFRSSAEALGVADRVAFHGRLSHEQVLAILKQSDLFCYPTCADGFPKVVLEALACGLPVITTKVSVLPELLKTGCGVLLPEPTPEALAAAVRSCLSVPQRYHAMSMKAIETARGFSLERWRDVIAEQLRLAWGPLDGRV